MTLYYLTIDDCDGLTVESYVTEKDRAVAAARYIPDHKTREALEAAMPGTREWFEVYDEWLSNSYLDIRFTEGCLDCGDNKTVLVLLPVWNWEKCHEPETRKVHTTSENPEQEALGRLFEEFDGFHDIEDFKVLYVLEGHQ